MKKKKILKIILAFTISIIVAFLLLWISAFTVHSIKTHNEVELLKREGYYNLVSVGDYNLNVAKFGNPDGKHTIVGLAGLGSGDYSVSMRKTTRCLEKDNLVVFVDRAGYGFSDDTNNEMTFDYIVEDYRKALKSAKIKGPYILMPHSIGGAYANYWANKYPDEIEGIVFIDGSQLCEDAFVEEIPHKVGFSDKCLAFLARTGISRLVIRNYFYHYPDNFSEEEQYLGDALEYMTLDSIAPVSEAGLLSENAQAVYKNIVADGIPKVYICASWGMQTKEDLIETGKWMNRQFEINNLNYEKQKTEYSDTEAEKVLKKFEKMREDKLYPYIEKMGNCKIVYLAGDHMIYQQRPEECGEIIKNFVENLH